MVSCVMHLARHHDREARRIGDDEVGRDHIRPVLQAAVDLGIAEQRIYSHTGCVIGGEEAAADIALVGLGAGIAAEHFVEMLEVRQVGHVGHQALDPRLEGLARVRRRPGSGRGRPRRAISASTRTSWATSLRVLLMFDWNSTELREVLLIWMLYSFASMPLNCVPSNPAVPHTRVMRVGSRQNSSSSQALQRRSPSSSRARDSR